MARNLFGIEKGVRLYKENSDTEFVDVLFGDNAPIGTAGETDDAPIGSQYADRVNGDLYIKRTATSSASDWIKFGETAIDELSWRNELVRAATNDTVAAGVVDPTGFSDNESGLDGNDFAVGEYLLGDVDGVPALFEVTVVTGATSITVAAASQPIASNDTFVVQTYLPDVGASQEAQAIIHVPVAGSPSVKIGDINWNFADGINLAAGYTPASGDITAADTVQSAIEKLDGNNDAQDSVLGTAQGDTTMGAFASPASLLLAASQSVKQLFQRVGDLLAQLRGVEATGITAEAVVDSVPHATVKACKWLITAFEEATPANRKSAEIYAMTDGTSTDDTEYSRLKLGGNFNLVLSTDVNGANMELRAASSTAGVTVTARRIEVIKSVL